MPIFSMSLLTSSLANTIFDLPYSVVLNSKTLVREAQSENSSTRGEGSFL